MDSYLRQNLDYDANGNRLSDTYWDKVIYADGGTAAGFTTERYTYDAINRLTTLRRDGLLLDAHYYDGAGRLYSVRVLKMTNADLSRGYAITYSVYHQAGSVTGIRKACPRKADSMRQSFLQYPLRHGLDPVRQIVE
ncbi:hypothetical protein DDE05_44315 [Streptomyces cavourensis]|nr:hypothetical protein DDE05_44315 [Streptomyces cavourensis]